MVFMVYRVKKSNGNILEVRKKFGKFWVEVEKSVMVKKKITR